MLCEGARDFFGPFLRIGFEEVEKVKTDIRSKALPRYMPIFEKVSRKSASKISFLGNFYFCRFYLLVRAVFWSAMV